MSNDRSYNHIVEQLSCCSNSILFDGNHMDGIYRDLVDFLFSENDDVSNYYYNMFIKHKCNDEQITKIPCNYTLSKEDIIKYIVPKIKSLLKEYPKYDTFKKDAFFDMYSSKMPDGTNSHNFLIRKYHVDDLFNLLNNGVLKTYNHNKIKDLNELSNYDYYIRYHQSNGIVDALAMYDERSSFSLACTAHDSSNSGIAA